MNRFWAIVFLSLILSSLSCKRDESVVGPGNQSDGRISIINDQTALSARVTYFSNQTVPIDSIGVGLPKRTGVQAFSLILRAEVSPPSIGGQVLQATSVVINKEQGDRELQHARVPVSGRD